MSPVEMLRALRTKTQEKVNRQNLMPLSVDNRESLREVGGKAVGVCLITWFVLWGVLSFFPVESPSGTALSIGVMATCLFLIFPFVALIRFSNKRIRLNVSSWEKHSPMHQFLACMALLLFLGTALNDASRHFLSESTEQRGEQKKGRKNVSPPKKKSPTEVSPKSLSDFIPVTSAQMYFFIWPFFSLLLWFSMAFLYGWSQREKEENQPSPKSVSKEPSSFTVWLGQSTGSLAKLWHDANMKPYQHIGLSLQDASQNIVVLGAIGSGKTTRAMHPLLVQLLDQECGGLIFDIKGDFQKAVTEFSRLAGRSVTFIGVKQGAMNLLDGLSPEIATSFLKSALLLGGNARVDSFWVDTGVELCRSALGVLSFVPGDYTLKGLYLYLFDTSFQENIDGLLKAQEPKAEEGRRLKTYQHYLKSVFASFDEKIRSGVLANVSQILSPFQHPDLVDAFCTPKTEPHRMECVLDGTVYCVDMPLAQWGLGGKVIYTLIKLRFFNLMQKRALHKEWNQTRPVFFMCDEYQEIVSCNKDGLSDLNFWDKSRSSHTIGIISAQSVSSFYAAIGDRDLVHALLQNFGQKLVFRVEDDWTISYCKRLLGQVETQKLVHSTTTSHGSNGSNSSTQSINYQQKEVIDGQLFRTMEPNQALALLSIKGRAADDVLTVQPVFVGEG